MPLPLPRTHRGWPIALGALLALSACAMKDAAPTSGASEAPMMDPTSEEARGGEGVMAQTVTLKPAPPPVDAPAPTGAESQLDNDLDDAIDDGDLLQGLGMRGTGPGGGGAGNGAIGGLGKLDVGGGKGYGGGAPEKKKAKRRVQAARKSASRAPAPAKLALDGFFDEEEAPPEPEAVAAPAAPAEADRLEPREKKEAEKEEEKEEEKAEEKAQAPARQRDAKPEPIAYHWAFDAPPPPDEANGRAFETMLAPLDGEGLDGRLRVAEYAERFVQPPRFIPRMCYFENTYLGGNAAYTERLRRLDDALPGDRRVYRRAALPQQPFDAPGDAGLALTTTLDRAYVDRPQRVFLQVGLQGSKRFGWRRPPLDIALVVDGSALDDETLVAAITALSRRLGPQDRLGVVLATARPIVLGELTPLRDRLVLARAVEALGDVPAGPPGALAAAMRRAGGMLRTAVGESARIPGTQTVLVLTRGAVDGSIDRAREAAHGLTVQGAVTSVIQLGGGHQGWWQVANAGHGNYHRGADDTLGAAVDDELGSISRVIARLLRINVKLADGVEAIRIVGSRVLGQQEVKQVKAREEATDRNLSKTMGVKADRGDDDDGVQTVIPYFYGGDSHVILLELWVTRPGPVAEVTLKYKDMVALQNATARVAARLDRVPRELTPAERRVAANVRGFQLAEGLATAAGHAERGDRGSALQALGALDGLALGGDRRMVEAFEALVRERGADRTVAEALRMAHDRRIGHSP